MLAFLATALSKGAQRRWARQVVGTILSNFVVVVVFSLAEPVGSARKSDSSLYLNKTTYTFKNSASSPAALRCCALYDERLVNPFVRKLGLWLDVPTYWLDGISKDG